MTGISVACINVKVSQACESYLFRHFGLNLSISYTKSALFGNNHRPKRVSQSLHSHLHPYCFISTLYYVIIFPFAIFLLLNINSVQLHHLHHVTSPPHLCLLAILNLDNTVVDLETLQALYENVSITSSALCFFLV